MPKLIEYKISTIKRGRNKTEAEGTLNLCTVTEVLNEDSNLLEERINRIKFRNFLFVFEGTVGDKEITDRLNIYCKENFPHLELIN